MTMSELGNAMAGIDWFGLVVIPLAIFGARIVDVSIGTLRIVFIGRGMAVPAAVVGFFESLIWLLAVSQIIKHLTMPLYYVAYAAGFGTGNYVGLMIERRLAVGTVVLRLFTSAPVDDLLDRLRRSGIGATTIAAQGLQGPVSIVSSVLARRELPRVLEIVQGTHPETFYTVEGLSQVDQTPRRSKRVRRRFRFLRQRK
jgi:uncharacterized protein YebE (UPF0316 family)